MKKKASVIITIVLLILNLINLGAVDKIFVLGKQVEVLAVNNELENNPTDINTEKKEYIEINNEYVKSNESLIAGDRGANINYSINPNIENTGFINMPYKYDIKTGQITINSKKYKIEVAEDGVLLIYEKENESDTEFKKLIASSKEDMSDCSDDDKLTHKKTDKTKFYIKTENDGTKLIYDQNDKIIIQSIVQLEKDSEDEELLESFNDGLNSGYYTNKISGTKTFNDIIKEIAKETTTRMNNYLEIENEVIEGINNVILPYGIYLIDCGYSNPSSDIDNTCIIIPTNTHLDLNGSVIKEIRNKKNYNIFRIDTGEEITITNGILLGDKAERAIAESQELGSGIMIRPISDGTGNYVTINNINIENLDISYMSGDGVYTNGKSTAGNSTYTADNICIRNNIIHECNRQGISLENNRKIEIINNTITNIIGTDPSACIDIEPPIGKNTLSYSRAYYLVNKVIIKNNIFENKRVLLCMNGPGDIEICNNEITGYVGINNVDGKMTIEKNDFRRFNSSSSLSFGFYEHNNNENDIKKHYPYTTGNNNYYKMNPQCVIMDENTFYGFETKIFDGEYIDIKNNKYTNDNGTKSLIYTYDSNIYVKENSNEGIEIKYRKRIEDEWINAIKDTHYKEYKNESEIEGKDDPGYIRIVQPSKNLVYLCGIDGKIKLKNIKEKIEVDTKVNLYSRSGEFIREIPNNEFKFFFYKEGNEIFDSNNEKLITYDGQTVGIANFDESQALTHDEHKIGIYYTFKEEGKTYTFITYQTIKVHEVQNISKIKIDGIEYNVKNGSAGSINNTPIWKIGDTIDTSNKDQFGIKFYEPNCASNLTATSGFEWCILDKNGNEKTENKLTIEENDLIGNQIVLKVKLYGVEAEAKVTIDNKYTVRFEDFNGTELQSEELEYGEIPIYKGEDPHRKSTNEYNYTFIGWDKEIKEVTEDITYIAQYKEVPIESQLIVDIGEYEEISDGKTIYLSGINPNTLISELQIDTNGKIEIYEGEEKIENNNVVIKTGTKIIITKNNQKEEYISVVKGDLTGDGMLDDRDLLKMARYGANLDKSLTGAYLKAANIVKDDACGDDIDLLKMARILVGLDNMN